MSKLMIDQTGEFEQDGDDLNAESESLNSSIPARFKYPGAERSKTLTPDLEELAPIEFERHGNTHRIEYDEDQSMPEEVNGFTDGHRLFYKSNVGSRSVKGSYLIYFYFLGILSLLASLLSDYSEVGIRFDDYIFPALAAILLPWAIIVTVIRQKRPIDQFSVFDRDSGYVLFTGSGRWPDLVVPFEKVAMYTEHYVNKGSRVFCVKLDCKARPKGMWGRRTDVIMSMGIANHEEVISQWAYINRFMDKTRPLPEEPVSTWRVIQWFKERNLTIDEIMNKNGFKQEATVSENLA